MALEITEPSDEQFHKPLRSSRPVDNSPPASPWMAPSETAKYLGIALGTLRNWTSARFIPFSKKGRVVRYNRTAIDRWLATGGCAGRATLADV